MHSSKVVSHIIKALSQNLYSIKQALNYWITGREIMNDSWQISLIFFIVIPIFIILKSLKPTKKLKLPPGPPKLPIIGNLHQLASKKTPPHRRLQELATVYGPIMHLRLGEVSTVIISSAEFAKAVMRTHDANFANRPDLMLGKYLFYDYSDIGLAPYGEYWRQVRKIATLELFTAKRVQSFRAIREEETTNLVKSIAAEAAHGSLVNLSERVFGLLFDLTSRTVFSKKGKEQEAFRELVTLISNFSSGFAIGDLYPSIKLLQSIGGMKKTLKEMVEESNKILDPIIQEHISNMKQGKVFDQEDLVDVLLKYHQHDPDHHSFSLTTNNIKGIILELFGAGSETSSTAIEWVMAELMRNVGVMKKVQNEIREVYKGKGTVDETRLDELKYLKMVIIETLRLHPPLPLLVPRQSIEECQILSYDIPPKFRVVVNVHAIGRDPNYWSEANEFKPERFETRSIDYKGNHFELLPFGAGRRMCPGMAFGIANVELPLAMLLYHFDWKLPNEMRPENLDMDELFGITVRKKIALHVIAVPYEYSCLKI